MTAFCINIIKSKLLDIACTSVEHLLDKHL